MLRPAKTLIFQSGRKKWRKEWAWDDFSVHSPSALLVYYGSDFAQDFVPKKSFCFPFNCQIGTNIKSDMEKEPWIKKTHNPNPAGFKAIRLFCLNFVKIEINHYGEETEVTGSILVFR